MKNEPIKLIQHTPYIHFQHNHNGATLRGSDLKPRIDKYLGGTQKYQLTISATLENGYPKDKTRDDPYFGKHKLCCYKDIELRFNTYFDTTLKDKIEKVIPNVFALENFGSFGSKGYGCFTIDGQNHYQDDFQKLLKAKYNTVYHWDVNSVSDTDIFFQIKYLYAIIKSGINIPDSTSTRSTYYKSKLMKYFLREDIRWEKRGIKKKFGLTPSNNITGKLDQTNITIPPPPPPDETYKAIKSLFGYSKSQEWRSYRKSIGIDFPKGIDRINSPIFFKVFKQNNMARIYFMLKNSDKFVDKIYPNKKFTYEVSGISEDFYTPDKFDYPKFLKYAVTEINYLTPKSATKSPARKVDDFIRLLTTNKIKSL